MGFDTAVVDVDGTLVDSNYHHARAWQRAFDEVGLLVPAWRIHRAIGMGGEKLVAFVTSDVVERTHGDRIRERWEFEVDAVLHEIQAFEGATAFLEDLRERGLKVVLASSGRAEHTEHALEVLDARGRVDHVITSQDVDATKPEPDLLVAALDAAGGASALVFGDTVSDAEAAQRSDMPMVGLLTGGFRPCGIARFRGEARVRRRTCTHRRPEPGAQPAPR
ncbi:MAG: HAD family hydrolase [Propionibacteriales bacterium]|nr:HAD family hydrolase [Propionibacteriales bacterium]